MGNWKKRRIGESEIGMMEDRKIRELEWKIGIIREWEKESEMGGIEDCKVGMILNG